MKILSLIHRYHPAIGGAESHLAAINRRLVARGHDITVLTSDAAEFPLFWDPSAARLEEHEGVAEGVRILRFPVQHLPFSKMAFPAMRLITEQVAHLLPNSGLVEELTTLTPRLPALRRWLQQTDEPFDLVMGTTITLEGIVRLGVDFARDRGLPFVVMPLSHLGAGSEPGSDSISHFYTMPQQQQIVLAADGLIAITPAEREFYVRRGFAPENSILAPSAPEPQRVAGGDGNRWREQFGVGQTPLVAVVSALTKEKGTLHTLAAMRQLWRAGHPIKLVLAGSPMADFEQAVAGLDPAEKERLILRGKVSDAERNDLLAAADVFCMPSLVESFGIAFTEAMLYKKPVIGAEVWGVKEFVIRHGENGLLVAPGNTEQLAQQILQLVQNPDTARQMGENGFAFASGLSWERSVDEIERLLLRLTRTRSETEPSG